MSAENLVTMPFGTRIPDQVSFHRTEVAIFSVFRRTAEHPMYRIEKRPKLAGKQGQYSVVGMDGRILRRGNDLKNVLRVLEKKLIRAVD